LKHLHLLCLRTSYSLAQFLYAPVFYKGKIVAGRKSPNSLYDPKIATTEGEVPAYDQSDATGYPIECIPLENPSRAKKGSRSKMNGQSLSNLDEI
jgi:hypothetical protein